MAFNPDYNKQGVEVIFSNKRSPSNFETLIFNGIPVKKDSETKHLGMILDSKLNFEKHLKEKLSKTNSGLGMMKRIMKWVSRKTQVYKLYIRPHLDYGDILYDISVLDKNEIVPVEN